MTEFQEAFEFGGDSKEEECYKDKELNCKAICNVITRLGGLVSGTMLDRGNQISVLVAKNSEVCSIHVQVDGMLHQGL